MTMVPHHLETLILRDLDTVIREIEAYPDDAAVWSLPPGAPNSAGTLALHVAGNLHHYIGAVLGDAPYVRARDAEFGDRDLPRRELIHRLRAARSAVEGVLSAMTPEELSAPFPVELSAGRPATELFVTHLATHLAYHLGQLDYHRRLVTGDPAGVDAQAMGALGTG